MLVATCHYGAIQLEVPEKPTSLTECSCSICRRLGALWAYYSESNVNVIAAANTILRYTWGNKRISFCCCSECGCTTHYDTAEANPATRMAINARMLDAEELESVPVKKFDGADTWQYVDD